MEVSKTNLWKSKRDYIIYVKDLGSIFFTLTILAAAFAPANTSLVTNSKFQIVVNWEAHRHLLDRMSHHLLRKNIYNKTIHVYRYGCKYRYLKIKRSHRLGATSGSPYRFEGGINWSFFACIFFFFRNNYSIIHAKWCVIVLDEYYYALDRIRWEL